MGGRHPEVTQRYREARRIAQANQEGSADTEDLRQAVTSYRSLVEALLSGDGDTERHGHHRDQDKEQGPGGRPDRGRTDPVGPDRPTNGHVRGERDTAAADENERETRP